MSRLARTRISPKYRLIDLLSGLSPVAGTLGLTDGLAEPDTVTGKAVLYVDTLDGDLKVKFADGTIKTIMTDT